MSSSEKDQPNSEATSKSKASEPHQGDTKGVNDMYKDAAKDLDRKGAADPKQAEKLAKKGTL